MTYFDYQANTPIDENVLKVYIDASLNDYANPNSFHKLGLTVKEKIDKATLHISKNLGCLPEEIIYTSGATESNNLAIKGLIERYKHKGKHILVGPFEHNSLMAALLNYSKNYEIEVLAVDKNGQIDLNDLKAKLRDDTLLVSVASVDSELLIRQPIEEIAQILKNTKTYFHTDASQAIGKDDFDFKDINLVTLTPHKFYGMNGSGLLIKRNKTSLKPLIDGGRSTTMYRSGTPVTAQILAMEKAIDIAINNQGSRYQIVKQYHDELLEFFKKYKKVHINTTSLSLPHVINFSIESSNANKVAHRLEDFDIYLSTKSSCCPENTPSKPIYALTRSKNLAQSSVRLSLSHLTQDKDIEAFKKAFDIIYKEFVNE